MERSELEIIKELMAELEDKMQPSHDDFEERLGRKKPEVKIMKIEGDMPVEGEEMMESKEPGMEDMEMSEMGEDEKMSSPDEMLKRRLMKLRS